MSEDTVSPCLRFAALLRFQHMWYQTDLHGCDKANSQQSPPWQTNLNKFSNCAPNWKHIGVWAAITYENLDKWPTTSCTGNYPCYCKQLGSQTDVQVVPAVAPVWMSERYFCVCDVAGMFCYGMAVGCGSASPALHQVYIQGLMTLRNVNQRFNKQNQSHIWCTQMCTKWLQYPSGPSIFYFLFFFGCRMGGDNEKIQWIRSHDL